MCATPSTGAEEAENLWSSAEDGLLAPTTSPNPVFSDPRAGQTRSWPPLPNVSNATRAEARRKTDRFLDLLEARLRLALVDVERETER